MSECPKFAEEIHKWLGEWKVARRNGAEIRIRCSERTMQTKRLSTYRTNGSSSLPEVVDARQQSGYNVIVQCRHQRKNEKVASASAVAPLSPRRLECWLALTMCGKTRQPHGSVRFRGAASLFGIFNNLFALFNILVEQFSVFACNIFLCSKVF